MYTRVELEGVNGEWFTLAGQGEGDRGCYLGTGVKGLFDPPVKAVYEEPGNYPGSRYLSHRVLRRDIVFGVEIFNDGNLRSTSGSEKSWLSRDSEWRKAWAFDRDCRLHVTTDSSGKRSLSLRLLESPDVEFDVDPNVRNITRVGMTCIAPDPFWYGDDVVYSAVTRKDTRFDPAILPWPWPQEDLPEETIYIDVDPSDGRGGLNPTDQYIFPKWTLPCSLGEPSEPYIPFIPWLGAPASPATIWTVPDYSFEDEEYADRRVRMPGLIGGLKTNEVQVVTVTGQPTSYTLTFNGHTTASIAYNASANTLESRLAELPNLTSSDIDITQNGSEYQVKFQGVYEGVDVPQMTRTVTGGDAENYVSVTTHTEGYTAPGENAVVDTDPRVEQVASQSGSALWSRMNGVRFRHPIPPYTPSKRFALTVSGARPGQMATLRLPRPWSRPWGLE